jgi:hypothetical protein
VPRAPHTKPREPANGSSADPSPLPSFPKAGFGVSGGWNAEIRTGFLRELSDGSGSAGLAARKSYHELFSLM